MAHALALLAAPWQRAAIVAILVGTMFTPVFTPGAVAQASAPFQVPNPPPRPPGPDTTPATTAPARAEQGRQQGRIWRVGPGEALRRISDAAQQAQDGDTVEIRAGDYRGDVAVWTQKRLSIRGTGGRARLFADGQAAEGKAIWVFRAGVFDISHVDFIGTRVADKNGAGIRMEGGQMRVAHCLFWGNENGILTTESPTATLDIEDSEFGYNGAGDGRSHNLYVGRISALRVQGSYFHHANVGHLLKSRAERNDILYNRLTDESGGRASYELDLPNGGVAMVMGNVLQQSPDTENATLIAFGLEGLTWPQNRLSLSSNTLVNDLPRAGTFLRMAQGTEPVVSVNNLLVGPGAYPTTPDTRSLNDEQGGRALFRQAAAHDYRLSDEGKKLAYQDPGALARPDAPLVPRRTLVMDRLSSQPLSGRPRYVGALQDEPPVGPRPAPGLK